MDVPEHTIDPQHIWISRPGTLAGRDHAGGPLTGRRIAVKDNIDVAGLPTTAGCPSYAYAPTATATAVQRLVDAGARVVGKTNLDQFATGLVGTRSPYGAVESPVAPGRVAGGSSSGSAAAVARGEADIGIGTDTAGSGRVPAAFCGVVGLKGTRGWVPNTGVVPACPSFDCTTVFARTVAEAGRALRTMAGPDPDDPFSRVRPNGRPGPVRRIGVPDAAALAGCDDATLSTFHAITADAARTFAIVQVDLSAYFAAGELLYGGAFVAERTASVGDFLAGGPVDVDPSVASIILGGARFGAVDYVRDLVQLARLRTSAALVWDCVDAVLLPTAPFHPSVAEVAADPIGVNSRLGRFVSGCNLVDWCAAAIPNRGADGGGVQVLGPAWSDEAVWSAAQVLLGER